VQIAIYFNQVGAREVSRADDVPDRVIDAGDFLTPFRRESFLVMKSAVLTVHAVRPAGSSMNERPIRRFGLGIEFGERFAVGCSEIRLVITAVAIGTCLRTDVSGI
jgi:hypothetical protein